MPQEPKKRHSRARQGKRRASIHLAVQGATSCPNCHNPIIPHTVCKHCGYYKGAQIKKTKSKAVVKKVTK